MHVDPPLISLFKSKNDTKLDKYCVKNKFHRDPTSEKLDLCEFKIVLFYYGETDELFLFVQNLQKTFGVSVILAVVVKNWCIFTLVRGEALQQIDTLYVQVGRTTTIHLNPVVLGLGTKTFPVNAIPNQNCAMSHIMRNL